MADDNSMTMSFDREPHCTWPELSEPFATALRQATEFVFRETTPVGIVATGTIVRGNPHASSDLDLYVVHMAPYRRRVQRFFAGVPTEIFINPPAAVRSYFADEDRDGRRLTAHMLATGTVVYSGNAVIDELCNEARTWLAKESRMSDAQRTIDRYSIATRLEDALDVAATDDVTASILLGDVVLAMLEYDCSVQTGRVPRRKDLLLEVARRRQELAVLAARFARSAAIGERSTVAIEIADRTIGVRGFFEWDSGPGPAAV